MVCDGDIQCEDGSDEDANYAGCGERGAVHLKALGTGRAGESGDHRRGEGATKLQVS